MPLQHFYFSKIPTLQFDKIFVNSRADCSKHFLVSSKFSGLNSYFNTSYVVNYTNKFWQSYNKVNYFTSNTFYYNTSYLKQPFIYDYVTKFEAFSSKAINLGKYQFLRSFAEFDDNILEDYNIGVATKFFNGFDDSFMFDDARFFLNLNQLAAKTLVFSDFDNREALILTGGYLADQMTVFVDFFNDLIFRMKNSLIEQRCITFESIFFDNINYSFFATSLFVFLENFF